MRNEMAKIQPQKEAWLTLYFEEANIGELTKMYRYLFHAEDLREAQGKKDFQRALDTTDIKEVAIHGVFTALMKELGSIKQKK